MLEIEFEEHGEAQKEGDEPEEVRPVERQRLVGVAQQLPVQLTDQRVVAVQQKVDRKLLQQLRHVLVGRRPGQRRRRRLHPTAKAEQKTKQKRP